VTFTDGERSELAALQDYLKKITPPAGAVNYSNTACFVTWHTTTNPHGCMSRAATPPRLQISVRIRRNAWLAS
jgi:hypothetical protein